MHRLFVIGATSLVALALSGAAQAWSWPADGDVLRPYTLGGDAYAAGQHRGIDVAGPDGSPVRAPASGTVSFAGSLPTYGRGVTILTDDGYAVTLVHLGSIDVAKGDAVTEGSGVGTMGSSGEPEHPAPSVHLGIRIASESEGYVDPLGLLPSRPAPVSSPPPAPVSAPVAVPVPAPATPSTPAPGPTPVAASQPAPPASAPSPPAAAAPVGTPPHVASPAPAAPTPAPGAWPVRSTPPLPASPTPAAMAGGGSPTADERHAVLAPEPVGAVPTVVSGPDAKQARPGSVETSEGAESRTGVAMEAAPRPQPRRAAVADTVGSRAVAAPRTRGEEAPSAARATAVAAASRPGAGAGRDDRRARAAHARKTAPRGVDFRHEVEVGAIAPQTPVGVDETAALVPGVARASAPSSARIVSRVGEAAGPRLPVVVAA
ncbi:MAG TPA: peptidoglycan DD-metalloendopeptidase family protein, partial [Gaiella sp.]|uniref:peptidoglycan DD-metalloendopeptidase family protein n=1 Tax=Gaiella sp. TaxID=2663207 RepID=UPI002D7F702C